MSEKLTASLRHPPQSDFIFRFGAMSRSAPSTAEADRFPVLSQDKENTEVSKDVEQREGEEKEQGAAKEQQTTLTESFPKVPLKQVIPRTIPVQGPTSALLRHKPLKPPLLFTPSFFEKFVIAT